MKSSTTRVYNIAIGATDMRKSINGLSLLVADQFDLDLFSGSYFAFCNRRRDVVKILYWAEKGFCLWVKRLETDVFRFSAEKARLPPLCNDVNIFSLRAIF